MKFNGMKAIRDRGRLQLPRWLKRGPSRRQEEETQLDVGMNDLESAAIAQHYRLLPRSSRHGSSRRKMLAQARRHSRTDHERAFRRTFRGITTQRTATTLAKAAAARERKLAAQPLGRTDA